MYVCIGVGVKNMDTHLFVLRFVERSVYPRARARERERVGLSVNLYCILHSHHVVHTERKTSERRTT